MVIKHLIPHKSLNHHCFIDDKANLFTNLVEKFGNLSTYRSANINPYPILLSNDIVNQIFHSHDLLIEAIQQIVKNYLIDHEIQELIKLPEEVIKLLHIVNDKDYNIGAIRPDFLIDKIGSMKMCEINARFPVNGFILSQRLSEVVSHQRFGTKTEPIVENKRIIKLISNFFDLTKPISVVKDKENGYDIHLLRNDLEKLFNQVVIHAVSPQELSLDKTGIYNGITHCDQFILELNQEELSNMNTDVLNEIITNSRYFNDIRTIFIVHDKRLLAVLHDEKIMKKYLSPKQFYQLQDYIVPTYILDDKIQKSIKNDPSNWVLKKYYGGKGEGMYIGKENNFTELENIFNQRQFYVAQPYIEQSFFKILNGEEINRVNYQNMRLVGMILSFNKNLLGPGFFRGSCGNIVNVSRYGGAILVPLRKKYV